MALIDDVKKALRISNSAHDTEVTDLIAAGKLDLEYSALDAAYIVDTDALVKRALTLYCKAHFGYDNPDAQRYAEAYEKLKISMALSGEYNAVE